MKNISTGIQAILAIAIIVLYILHFTQGSSPKTSPDTNPKEDTSRKATEETSQEETSSQKSTDAPRFAFVNSDTLVEKYEYYQTVQKQFQNKRASLEAVFRNRKTNFDNQVLAFQKSISQGTMDEQTAIQTQERLKQEEMNIIKDSQAQESNLIQEEQTKSKELNSQIANFLKRYAEDNGYDMIFSFSKNSLAVGVMYGDPEHNVTKEVIKGLNDEYKAKQDKK